MAHRRGSKGIKFLLMAGTSEGAGVGTVISRHRLIGKLKAAAKSYRMAARLSGQRADCYAWDLKRDQEVPMGP